MKKKNAKSSTLDFVSIASHQLRTPLTLMKGYLAMIIGGDFGPVKEAKLKSALTAVYQANERLIRLVENLLNMGALENGKLQVHREETDMVKLLRDVVKEMKPKAETKNLKLVFTAITKTLRVDIDPLLIRQVVLNLIDNAIKYTAVGKITVTLTGAPRGCSVSVADTGPGVEPKAVKHVFDKFAREDIAHSSEEGFGLGLYVCKLILAAHGGKIRAESRGKGFGFKVICEI